MIPYLLRRLGYALVSVLAASLIIFLMLEVLPGDPARFMMGINATEETVAALRQELGLNQPAILRFFTWLGGIVVGDFGVSYSYRVPVADLLAERLTVSLPLAAMALAMTVCFALPLGLVSARYWGRWPDTALMTGAQVSIALPNFWIAILLQMMLALSFRIFPAGGFPGWQSSVQASLWVLVLPALALAIPQAAILARVGRSAIVEASQQDYMRTARAKGLSLNQALFGHAFRNASLPMFTILGLQFAFLLAGAVIIETVFFLPGLGSLILQAIKQNDLMVVKSAVFLMVAAVILINTLVDIAYVWADPRVKLAEGL